MARWMKGPTSAETSTPDHLETRPELLWLAKRQGQRGSELIRWLFGLAICVATAYALRPPSDSATDRRLAQSRGVSEESLTDGPALDESALNESALDESALNESAGERSGEGTSGDEQSGAEVGASGVGASRSSDQPSLLWWTDASVAPTGETLIKCLARPGQAPIELRPHPRGYYVFTPGRPQPQALYARRGQLWLETPLLKTPHQQAYDHLAHAACVKAPSATLYDPQLVRQWSGASWPQRDVKSGGFSLDDLFMIRSEESAHYTHGLKRLGLPELGLISSAEGARDVLRWGALAWISAPKSRESLKATTPPPITVGGQSVSARSSREVLEWLGSVEVALLTDVGGRPLDERAVEVLTRSLKRSRGHIRSKSKRKIRSKGKSKIRSKSKRKNRRKSRRKTKTKTKTNIKHKNKSPRRPLRRDLLRYQ